MKHLKQIIIIIAIVTGICGYSQENKSTGLENSETSQIKHLNEVGNQPEVQVNQEMLDRFYEYKRNGSNIFLNWSLLQGQEYKMVKAAVLDYQTITLHRNRSSEYVSQK
ncbi:MAG: hypothetical protein GVY19_06830 [Bacteroidetes bacterium]|jgi:hypothetical protein|nr:hypothetical protein [Bacteroidota bacterium]